MIHSLIQLLFPNNGQSSYVNDICLWISDLVEASWMASGNDPEAAGYGATAITSLDLGFALIPWDNILACVVLCVFICCLFRFMRAVFIKSI